MGMRASIGVIGLMALAVVALDARTAKACGGCFHQAAGSQSFADITDERMLLSVSADQTTLYDQIRYAGDPASFAWVLPIKGAVTIGLSADVMFDSLDALTTTRIIGPFTDCPSCGGGGGGFGCGGSASALSADGTSANEPPPVTVTKQENVGPYETVQLHSNDGSGAVLSKWLTDNGYAIPDGVKTTVDAYVGEGFDFLAMKLLPGQGIQAMRPVRVTTPGGSLSLPLRMAAIGTGATVGITLWVVASGRYEPQNFPFFHIEDSDMVWDWKASASNYTTLRAQKEAELQARGWEIESSIAINTSTLATAIRSGGASIGSDGYSSGTTGPSNASDDYAATAGTDDVTDADSGALLDSGTVGATADQARSDDIAALIAPQSGDVVRVTRMRTDLAHAAMSVDLVLRASSDQSELQNIRVVTKSVNAPACPACADGGCDASPIRPAETGGFAATVLGLVGLVSTRIVRLRRRK